MGIPIKSTRKLPLDARRSPLFGRFWAIVAAAGLLCGIAAAETRNSLPFLVPAKDELYKIRSAIIYTSAGNILIELFPETAPIHVANFKFRADRGFYKNSAFDIYLPGYIIQGGKPTKSSGAPASYSLPPEFSAREHSPGVVGMARASDDKNARRESSGAQFHIILGESPHMDGNYTIFGRVKSGMAAVENLRQGSKITDIKVFIRPENQ